MNFKCCFGLRQLTACALAAGASLGVIASPVSAVFSGDLNLSPFGLAAATSTRLTMTWDSDAVAQQVIGGTVVRPTSVKFQLGGVDYSQTAYDPTIVRYRAGGQDILGFDTLLSVPVGVNDTLIGIGFTFYDPSGLLFGDAMKAPANLDFAKNLTAYGSGIFSPTTLEALTADPTLNNAIVTALSQPTIPHDVPEPGSLLLSALAGLALLGSQRRRPLAI